MREKDSKTKKSERERRKTKCLIANNLSQHSTNISMTQMGSDELHF